MTDLKRIWPYALIFAVTYHVLPLFGMGGGGTLETLGLLLLVGVNTLVNLVAGIVYGAKQLPIWWLPVASVILFLPSVFLFYNASALIYALVYAVFSLAGCGIGYILQKVVERDEDSA